MKRIGWNESKARVLNSIGNGLAGWAQLDIEKSIHNLIYQHTISWHVLCSSQQARFFLFTKEHISHAFLSSSDRILRSVVLADPLFDYVKNWIHTHLYAITLAGLYSLSPFTLYCFLSAPQSNIHSLKIKNVTAACA